ncbi:hypothetical protein ACQBAR_01060 [Propionibacteriaceae bacterium Y1685]
MAWRDWTTGTKVTVVVSALVSLAVIATFAVLVTRPNGPTPTPPPPSESSSSAPTPTPSPSPTYECTTAQGSECTKELSEKEAERDKILADAEAGYRAFFDAYVKQFQAGAGHPMSKELKASTHGGVTKGFEEDVQRLDDEGLYFDGALKLASLEVQDESPEWPTDKVVFNVCQDASDWRGIERDTNDLKYPGYNNRATATMLLVHGSWKLANNIDQNVDKC